MNIKKRQKKISALILLLVITIGYALLSTTLKINGIANIKSNTWDIHFENVVPNGESTVTAEEPSISDNATKVSYEVELSLPGDFYEFTVDAVNEGSINGIIERIEHNVYESDGVTVATLPSYIKYSIVYDGTTTAPQEGDILEAGESKTYRVRIEFDSEATTLPSTDLTYVIVDEVKYTQTKEAGAKNIDDIIDDIESDPDSYRNPDQSPTNLDIGLDENGNVINLDMWTAIGTGERDYYREWEEDYMVLGYADCDSEGEGDGCVTPATSDAQVVNGYVITPIPAYIKLAEEEHFYPVRSISYVFGDEYGDRENKVTTLPHLPNTITTLGSCLFYSGHLSGTITIPKQITKIEGGAFLNSGEEFSIEFEEGSNLKIIGQGAFDAADLVGDIVFPKSLEIIEERAFSSISLSSISFENGSVLTTIGDEAFSSGGISGDLVLPQTVTSIGKGAFYYTSLTSVTFPTSAQYFRYPEDVDCTWYASFNNDTVINHQY